MLALGKLEKSVFRDTKILRSLKIFYVFPVMQRVLFKDLMFIISISYTSPAVVAEATYSGFKK